MWYKAGHHLGKRCHQPETALKNNEQRVITYSGDLDDIKHALC